MQMPKDEEGPGYKGSKLGWGTYLSFLTAIAIVVALYLAFSPG